MAKPKAQTLQQRFGFADDDLKTPKHDEMMIWLDDVISDMLPTWVNWEPEWKPKAVEFAIHSIRSALDSSAIRKEQEIAKVKEAGYHDDRYKEGRIAELSEGLDRRRNFTIPDVPPKPEFSFYAEPTWEYVVTTNNRGNKFTVGFIDMHTSYYDYSLATTGVSSVWMREEKRYNHELTDEDPGFTIDGGTFDVFFELKSSIPSLGELIRQIRMYQEYVDGKWFVVSPDDRFEDQIKAQGIGFIKYQP